MLTQDATQRAAAMLKGATKPLRIFVGYSSSGRDRNILSASLDASRIKKTMPHAEFTVPHTLDAEQLAQAITDQWAHLRAQPKPKASAIPASQHKWRASSTFSRKRIA